MSFNLNNTAGGASGGAAIGAGIGMFFGPEGIVAGGIIGAAIGGGIGFVGDVFAGIDSTSDEVKQYQAEYDQAISNRDIAGLNKTRIQDQMSAYTIGMGEKMDDVHEQGVSQRSQNQALYAASGMGSAGTTKTQIGQMERRTTRDIQRLETNMLAQNKDYLTQINIATKQYNEYNNQATFASNAKKSAQTWNPFD